MQAAALLVSGLVAGLLAGTASCTAVQGGLLVGLSDRSSPGPSPGPLPGPSSQSLPGPSSRSSSRSSSGPGRAGDGGPVVAARVVIGWFLLGRFAAHTVLGALLGWLGATVQPPPPVRAALLVAAGCAVVVFAVRLLRGPRHACAPHGGTPARDRPSGRHPLVLAGSLGAATVLVPCGVTLGVEMVAVTSASALGGAAVMAGFVAGSAPAFALLGYVLRRVSRTRVARLAGVVALAAGLWTAGSGLNLGGWLPGGGASPAEAVTGGDRPAEGPITVWATRDGYRPGLVTAPAGVPVEIVFRLADPGACTRTVTIDGRDVPLPATVRLPPQPRGTLRYVCAMGMYTGFINFS
ncbi:sulfite exporter TauE/SafE family protein [Nonomuraea rhodomycinica]|uniref:Sulfite exporter TauE/SafE family protein n=1 Tax=Nonomuraea rhodomycinica TaxID=1712872 RepID=A0A7Y6MB00_9ACTN|nr:sulfite exporter TauE/SafE family protein [Nonomuraea rhodomycinica]NUW41192.1 sulfite exporter TauE/SafE family protein [Nonomuraea rhodomycinica]